MSFENSNFSARKPRLAKVRKQSRSRHGRSEPVAAPAARNGSGSNPFQSVSESFDAGKDPTVISNGFGASVADVKFGNVDNVGFVFGSSYSNSVSNLNSEQLGTKEFEKINNLGFSFGASSSNVGSNSNLKQRGSRQRTGQSSVNEFGNINNVNSMFEGAVFGKNKSHSVSNSKLEQKGSNAGHSGSYEFGKFENLGSLFGANKSSLTSNSNLEERVDRESGRKSRADDFREFDNLGFVFGSSKSNLVSNSKSENRESVGSARKSSDLEFTKFDNGFDANKVNLSLEKREFVFGSNLASSASNLDSKRTEPSEKVGKFIDEWGKIKEENKPEFRKLGTEGFEFGAKHTDSESNSNFGNITENVGKLVPDARGKMKLDNGENAESCETGSFVFGQTWSDLRSKSNPEKRDSGENEGKSKHLRKFGSEGFVFGVYQSDTTSSSDFEKRESSEFAGESVFEDGCKKKVAVETRFQKSNPDGVFVFGSDKISAFSESHKLNNEMNKVTNTSDENCTSFAKTHTDNVGSDVNSKNHFVFGHTTNADSASEASPVHKLSDDMNKLNVDNNEKVGGSEKAEDCNIGSCTAENLFVFGSQRKASALSNGSSETTSREFIRNLNFEGSLSGSTVEKTKKTNLETSDENAFVFTPSEENACSTDGGVSFVETKKNSSFTSMPDFGTPNRDSAFSFTANLFPGLHEKLDLSSMARSTRDRRLKKTRGKLRQAIPVNPSPDTPGCCSPMDFSPYQDNSCEPSAENSTASTNGKDEDLAASMKGTETNEEDKKCRDSTEKGFRNSSVRGNAESGDVNSNTKVQENQHKEQFGFASNSVDTGEINFTFSATKHRDKKKYRMKVGDGSNCSTPSQKFEFASSSAQFSPLASTSAHSDLGLGKKGEIYNSESKGERKARADEEDVKQGSETASMEEACEKWRMRGNQAYKNGYLSKAEEFYTKGVNSIPQSKASECCLEPLVLCYSNRAATRMSRGRMREALEDCIMASALDPNFVKIQIRAANCHLALGEVEDAMKHYSKCLESGSGICLDRRIIIEAADGLQKAQKVAKCTNQCAGLLRQRTSDAATKALGMIADALSLSFYSEKMFEMKGEALLMLQKYEEVIQLCEQTLEYAENNFAMVGADSDSAYTSGSKNSLVRLWRWRLMSKSYFHLGRLEVALDLLEKQELLGSTNDKSGSMTQGSSIPLAVTIRELLHFKNAGNEAFQSGRHTEAVEHYTAAVLNSIESRPFSAICFCNRAAANQALGQIADAIADCSLAIALDRNYTKAVSRRATLHETIKDYEQATCDLQRYISILEEQSHEKVQHSGTPDGPSGSNVKELRQARRRLSSVEEKAKKGTSLDLYLILGVKASDTVAEIKKAYRKAALRHHPDKAGQFLARSESGDDGQLWKEITDEVHKDADRLFKMIGEAYAVLSDPTKRSEYDYEEDQRKNIRKDRNGSSGFGRPSDHYSSPFESSNRRYWQESWKTHGSSYSRW